MARKGGRKPIRRDLIFKTDHKLTMNPWKIPTVPIFHAAKCFVTRFFAKIAIFLFSAKFHAYFSARRARQEKRCRHCVHQQWLHGNANFNNENTPTSTTKTRQLQQQKLANFNNKNSPTSTIHSKILFRKQIKWLNRYFPWIHGKFICKGEGKWPCPGLCS